jgi:hypothetical protein
MEDQYFQSSGRVRSYSALRGKLYQKGYGHLSNKKKKYSPGKHTASEKPSSVVSTPAAETVIDYFQLSKAYDFISNWLSSKQKKTAEPESEFENDNSLSRDYWGNNSVSHTSEESPETTIATKSKDHDAVTQPLSCNKSATKNAAERMNGPVVENEDFLNASPQSNTQSSHSERIERNLGATGLEEPQRSFSG